MEKSLCCLFVSLLALAVGSTSTINQLNTVLVQLIEKEVNSVVRNVLGELTPQLKHVRGGSHHVKTEIRRLWREVKLLRAERETCDARVARVFASETEHLALLTSHLRRDLDSTKYDIWQLKDDFSKFKEHVDDYGGRDTCDFIENRLQTLNSDVERLNSTQKELSQIKILVNMSTEATRLSILEDRFTKLEEGTSWDKFKILDDEIEYLKTSTNETMARLSEVETRLHDMKTVIPIENSHFNGRGDTSKTVKTTTTPLPQVTNMTRLLIADFYSSGTTLRQLHIDGNSVTTYPYLKTNSIEAVVYAKRRNAIIFSRDSPAGIYSSPLQSASITTLRNNIFSFGLAVDEGRDVLFLTTYSPRKTVSRMTTGGKYFTPVIDLKSYSNNPIGITLDTKKRMIYMSNNAHLFSVTYEGRNLRILHSGNNMRGVAIDYHRGMLYFNVNKLIWRRPISGGQNAKVGEIDSNVMNLVYYNNTVFICSIDNGGIHALYIYHSNSAVMKLTTVEKKSVIAVMP